ncbi:tRNA (N(6)-L-threonylcarbamoyladenosine(37)-C(2))-methylthiotransferase MtaB [Patescibacteria group bacterium]|nr:tRNA (N(6)-L-threonylcarbamoyladenosine(37)-C(2))-methylthiotransferase MtaB [Patescibacteria group bacterium]
MKISILTLGCKLNQAESDTFSREFQSRGFNVVPFKESPDVCVVNSCAVTHQAVRKTRQMINKIRNSNSNTVIVATGCSIEQKKDVDLFLSNKDTLVHDVLSFLKKDNQDDSPQTPTVFVSEKDRALIKIQEGCDMFCTYCIISRRRGPLNSVSPTKIVSEIKKRQKEGFKEVVLTGVNINKYSYKESLNLTQLLEYVLANTSIKRIRLGSLDPRFIDDDFIALWESKRLLNHWHLSLQSGSSDILAKMNRCYTREEYVSLVKKIRKIDPLFGVTTDIIVGFPGETDRDFMESLSIIDAARFSSVHVFPFSAREGTPAATMKDQVLEEVKQKRAHILRDYASESEHQFKKECIGTTVSVLFEDQRNGYFEGYTENYVRVYMPSKRDLRNTIKQFTLEGKNIIKPE